jgi:hypothetical protein
VQRVSHFLIPKSIYIADGHHRYETALAYREYRKGLDLHGSGSEAYNYVMMALVSFSDPGIVILPIHRLVRGIPAETLEKFKVELRNYFVVMKAPAGNVSLSGSAIGTIKLYGLEPGVIWGLTPLPQTRVNDFLTAVGGLANWTSAPCSIIEASGAAAGKPSLAYTSGESACRLVDEGQFSSRCCSIPFRSKPLRPSPTPTTACRQVTAYPKLPSGLVMFRTDGEI